MNFHRGFVEELVKLANNGFVMTKRRRAGLTNTSLAPARSKTSVNMARPRVSIGSTQSIPVKPKTPSHSSTGKPITDTHMRTSKGSWVPKSPVQRQRIRSANYKLKQLNYSERRAIHDKMRGHGPATKALRSFASGAADEITALPGKQMSETKGFKRPMALHARQSPRANLAGRVTGNVISSLGKLPLSVGSYIADRAVRANPSATGKIHSVPKLKKVR